MSTNERKVLGSFTVAASFVLPFLATSVAAQEREWSYGRHMMWDGGWWMFLGPLWMVLLLAIAVAGIVLAVRWLGQRDDALGQRSSSRQTPLEILQERFARGEIDRQEFEERKKVLE